MASGRLPESVIPAPFAAYAGDDGTIEPFSEWPLRLGTIPVAYGNEPARPVSQERPVSDVRVTIERDSEREERVVTTGTTAADLFPGERTVIAARWPES